MSEILCISNGHGEDQIGARICLELRAAGISAIALPLVGVGHAYQSAEIPIVTGSTQAMPSGGFVRMDAKELWRDVRGGLVGLTWHQLGIAWQWSRRGSAKGKKLILAVGDIVPLVFAWLPSWLGGCDYVFVATAKSEYFWRDRTGQLPNISKPISGSIFYPWERSLIQSSRATFVRDQLTAEVLTERFKLPVQFFGNPMMDGLNPKGLNLGIDDGEWAIALLPGSRPPEAYDNWISLLVGAQMIERKIAQNINFLAAIAPDLDLEILTKLLVQKGWFQLDDHTFTQHQSKLRLITHGFGDCLHQCHLGLGMAGTATEQLVGLGKPVITIVGKGPQFTRAFAQDQARLLGQSIFLVETPAQVTDAIAAILSNPDCFNIAIDNGKERMGTAGASNRIAAYIARII